MAKQKISLRMPAAISDGITKPFVISARSEKEVFEQAKKLLEPKGLKRYTIKPVRL